MTALERIGKTLGLLPKTKASEFEARVQRALYRYVGSNQIVWNDDNPEAYVTDGYNRNHLVYSIVQWVARKAAQIDFKVERVLPGGETEELQDHEVLEVLYNPNEFQGKSEYFEQFYGFLALTGNSYMWGARPTSGRNIRKPVELHTLPAPLVEIVRGTDFDPVRGYTLQFTDRQSEFAADEVLHLKYASYYYNQGVELYGVSPLMAGWYILQKSNSNTEAMKKSFDNMGALGVLFEKDNWEGYNDQQRKRAQAQLEKKVAGTDNKGRILYTGGDFGYINFGANPVDLALIDDAKMTLADLCRLYHVDPKLFGESEASTFNNLKEARKISYVDGVLPLVQMFCDEFTRAFLPAYGPNLRLKPVTRNIPELQADMKEQAEWLSKTYWLTENEKRKAMGYDEADEIGDVFHVPAGLIPFGSDLDLPSNEKSLDLKKKASEEEIDERFTDYKAAVNMSASELERWSETECSKLASQDRGPVRRNLELLRTNKADWTDKHYDWAGQTIAFIARMRKVEQGKPVREGCPSKRDISLKNWAFDPNK